MIIQVRILATQLAAAPPTKEERAVVKMSLVSDSTPLTMNQSKRRPHGEPRLGLRWLAGKRADTAFEFGLTLARCKPSKSGVCPCPSPTAVHDAGLQTWVPSVSTIPWGNLFRGYRPPLEPGEGQRPIGQNIAAYTLIEVVISSALMALILVSAYLCLNAGLNSQKLIEPRAEIIQTARVAMALLTADLRAACPLSKDYQFLGTRRLLGEMDADNLDFATHNFTPRHPHEGDFCEESFYLDQDPETGQFSLWRRRNPTIAPDSLSGGTKEEIAKGIVGVRFEYFDGLDWYDTWGEIKPGKRETSQKVQPNLSGMPNAVRITLMFDSNPKSKTISEAGDRVIEPPFAFQTVARLNLAANSSGGAADGASDSTGQEATPGTKGGGNF